MSQPPTVERAGAEIQSPQGNVFCRSRQGLTVLGITSKSGKTRKVSVSAYTNVSDYFEVTSQTISQAHRTPTVPWPKIPPGLSIFLEIGPSGFSQSGYSLLSIETRSPEGMKRPLNTFRWLQKFSLERGERQSSKQCRVTGLTFTITCLEQSGHNLMAENKTFIKDSAKIVNKLNEVSHDTPFATYNKSASSIPRNLLRPTLKLNRSVYSWAQRELKNYKTFHIRVLGCRLFVQRL